MVHLLPLAKTLWFLTYFSVGEETWGMNCKECKRCCFWPSFKIFTLLLSSYLFSDTPHYHCKKKVTETEQLLFYEYVVLLLSTVKFLHSDTGQKPVYLAMYLH